MVEIRPERADHPQIRALLAALDDYLEGLYPPAARIAERLLEPLEAALTAGGVALARLETGRDQYAAIRLYERCGYTRCAAFGGYADNGVSLFYEKRLTW